MPTQRKNCAKPALVSSASVRDWTEMPGFSQRIGRVQLAQSVQMTIKARELRAAGKPVITLTTGEPNFASPSHAIEAAHQAALQGNTKYPPQDGTRAVKR